MEFRFASFSRLGPRSSNQDRLLEPEIRADKSCLAAIADGIGGANGGEQAADIAIRSARAFMSAPAEIDSVFRNAVDQMKAISASDPLLENMGTTLSMALIHEGVVHTAHVGDTRIYHLRGAGLKTLTMDQTEVAELRRKGVLSASQARRYPRRNVLLSALSPADNYVVHQNTSKLEAGDRLLLVSDGVYQRLTRGAIVNRSVSSATIEELMGAIEIEVSDKEPSDNFSAIGIEIIGL